MSMSTPVLADPPSLRVAGFDQSGGTDNSDLNGMYCRTQHGTYYKRVPPIWIMWHEPSHGTWFIGDTEGDRDSHVARFPNAQWLVTKPQKIEATINDSNAATQITVHASTSAIIKAGFLTKSPPPGALKGWKRRYFMLTVGTGEPKLEYFKSIKDVDSKKPQGVVLLGGCKGVAPGEGQRRGSRTKKAQPSADDAKCIRLTLPNRDLELLAETRVDYRNWMTVLKEACGQDIRLRVGPLQIAPVNATKYAKFFAVLDAAHLKFFDSEAHTGTEKKLQQHVAIQDITHVELVPSSAYFNITLGESGFSLKAVSTQAAVDWVEDIKSLLFDDVAEKVQTPGRPKLPSGDAFSQFKAGEGSMTLEKGATLSATAPTLGALRPGDDGQEEVDSSSDEETVTGFGSSSSSPNPPAQLQSAPPPEAAAAKAAEAAREDARAKARAQAAKEEQERHAAEAEAAEAKAQAERKEQERLAVEAAAARANADTEAAEASNVTNAATRPVGDAPSNKVVLDRSGGKGLGIKLLKAPDGNGFLVKSVDTGGQAEKFAEIVPGRRISYVNAVDVKELNMKQLGGIITSQDMCEFTFEDDETVAPSVAQQDVAPPVQAAEAPVAPPVQAAEAPVAPPVTEKDAVQATAAATEAARKVEEDRLASEAAAGAEKEKEAAEAQAMAETVAAEAKAAAEAAASMEAATAEAARKVEEDRLAAEAVAEAEKEKEAAEAQAKAERDAAEAKAAAEEAAAVEAARRIEEERLAVEAAEEQQQQQSSAAPAEDSLSAAEGPMAPPVQAAEAPVAPPVTEKDAVQATAAATEAARKVEEDRLASEAAAGAEKEKEAAEAQAMAETVAAEAKAAAEAAASMEAATAEAARKVEEDRLAAEAVAEAEKEKEAAEAQAKAERDAAEAKAAAEEAAAVEAARRIEEERLAVEAAEEQQQQQSSAAPAEDSLSALPGPASDDTPSFRPRTNTGQLRQVVERESTARKKAEQDATEAKEALAAQQAALAQQQANFAAQTETLARQKAEQEAKEAKEEIARLRMSMDAQAAVIKAQEAEKRALEAEKRIAEMQRDLEQTKGMEQRINENADKKVAEMEVGRKNTANWAAVVWWLLSASGSGSIYQALSCSQLTTVSWSAVGPPAGTFTRDASKRASADRGCQARQRTRIWGIHGSFVWRAAEKGWEPCFKLCTQPRWWPRGPHGSHWPRPHRPRRPHWPCQCSQGENGAIHSLFPAVAAWLRLPQDLRPRTSAATPCIGSGQLRARASCAGRGVRRGFCLTSYWFVASPCCGSHLPESNRAVARVCCETAAYAEGGAGLVE